MGFLPGTFLMAEQLDEVLSTAARIKKRAIMKRLKTKIMRGQKKARLRVASKETLLNRSKKRARSAVAKKMMKKSYAFTAIAFFQKGT